MEEWKYTSSILNLDIGWKWVVSFTTLPLSPQGQGWVGSRASLDVMEKRKICCPYRESNSGSSVVKPVAWLLYWLSYSGLSLRIYSQPKKQFYEVTTIFFEKKMPSCDGLSNLRTKIEMMYPRNDDIGYVLLCFGIMYSGRRVLVLNTTLKTEAAGSSETLIISCCTSL
jgi:hypothetical protein